VTQDVVVGYIHGATVTQEFHHSLAGMFIRDAWGSRRILNFAPQYRGANICKSRNQMVNDMLAQDNAEWLLILDSDAVFAADLLDRLLWDADPQDRPIVGGLAHQYRGKVDENFDPVLDERGVQIREVQPTMYKTEWDEDGGWIGYREVLSYRSGLNEVDATGCHCLLVHRTVFEKIESDHPYRWFREDQISPGVIAGEDIWFCVEATRHGFPVYVDTTIEVGHAKVVVLDSTMSHVERIT
jgi:GT2 family glycosyltransferase